MTRSWIAKYWAVGSRATLLGGVPHSQSSRWGAEHDAHTSLETTINNNGGLLYCDGEVVPSREPPEIFIHCGAGPAQALGSKCFRCGKVLTYKDAQEHQPQPIQDE